jgi:hypothetical protein
MKKRFRSGLIIVLLVFLTISIFGCAPAPTANSVPTSATVLTSTPEPKHWISKIDPVDVLKSADLVPFGKKVEVAPNPNDPTLPYDFTAYGEYIVEKIPGHGTMAGEKGTDTLGLLIPDDLVDAFPENGKVQIKGRYFAIEGAGGYIGIALEVIRDE